MLSLEHKTIIFDLDGTLFRTDTVDIIAVNKTLAQMGLVARHEEEIIDSIGLTMRETCIRFGIREEAAVRQFEVLLTRHEMEQVDAVGEMYEGAPELIRKLSEGGYPLCICSNGSGDYVHKVLDKFGLTEFFREIWTQTDGYTKTMAVASLAERHVGRNGFLMVGDRDIDFLAGKANGGITIGLLHGFGGDEPYSADHTAANIAELEKIIMKMD